MPTFASIDLHPDLRKRLVSQFSLPATAANRKANAQVFEPQPIKTPQSLLSRNPKTIHLLVVSEPSPAEDGGGGGAVVASSNNAATTTAKTRPIALDKVKKLRVDVALALMKPTKAATHIQRVQEIFRDKRQRPPQEQQLERPSKRRKSRHDPLTILPRSIPGTASALELLHYHSHFHQAPRANGNDGNDDVVAATITLANGAVRRSLSTGCRSLDALLACNATSPLDTSTSGSSSNNSTTASSSSSGGGIPLGLVTQISGPPASGKTQFALHLIATATSTANAPPAPQQKQQQHQQQQQHGYSNPRNTVETWYICSGGTCTPTLQRLADLCGTQHGVHANAILESTFFCPASNEYDVLRHLATLESRLEEGFRENVKGIQEHNAAAMKHDKPRTVLLILDSCSGCLSASSSFTSRREKSFRKKNSANGLFLTVGATIRRLTRYYQLATVLINGTVSSSTFTRRGGGGGAANMKTAWTAARLQPHPHRSNKPALGQRWNNSVPDICLWFERASIDNDTSSRHSASSKTKTVHLQMAVRATLDRHEMKKCRTTARGQESVGSTSTTMATFFIAANGVQDHNAQPPE